MGALSTKLRSIEMDGLLFWCPGCDSAHVVWVGTGPGARWSWNGDAERPTFQPSLLVRLEQWLPPYGRDPDTDRRIDSGEIVQQVIETRCHSFIRDGRIQFLGDCTHLLAGQTVDLPDFDS